MSLLFSSVESGTTHLDLCTEKNSLYLLTPEKSSRCTVIRQKVICASSLISESKTSHTFTLRNSDAHLLFHTLSGLVPPAYCCPRFARAANHCGRHYSREKSKHTSIGVADSRSEGMWRFRP